MHYGLYITNTVLTKPRFIRALLYGQIELMYCHNCPKNARISRSAWNRHYKDCDISKLLGILCADVDFVSVYPHILLTFFSKLRLYLQNFRDSSHFFNLHAIFNLDCHANAYYCMNEQNGSQEIHQLFGFVPAIDRPSSIHIPPHLCSKVVKPMPIFW